MVWFEKHMSSIYGHQNHFMRFSNSPCSNASSVLAYTALLTNRYFDGADFIDISVFVNIFLLDSSKCGLLTTTCVAFRLGLSHLWFIINSLLQNFHGMLGAKY